MLCGVGLWLAACGIADRRVEERLLGAVAGEGGGNAGGSVAGLGQAAAPVGGTAVYSMGGMGPPFPGGAMGGMYVGGFPFGGAPPMPIFCGNVPDVPACSSEGGSPEPAAGAPGNTGSGGAAGAAVSDAGAAGTDGNANALVPWCVRPASVDVPNGLDVLVDDLEDGDDLTPPFLNGRGAWFTVNDGSGQQFPNPSCPPALPSTSKGTPGVYAMHTYGKGFSLAPGGYSLLGISAKSGATCNQPVDATGFSGVRFSARGSGFVRFFMGTVETNPTADFGTCQGGCYDSHGAIVPLEANWNTYRISFDQVIQEGWGAPAPFNRAHILTLQWSAKPGPGEPPTVSCFDFWIDDVAFYR